MQFEINNHKFFSIQFDASPLNFKLFKIFYIHHFKLIEISIIDYQKN